MVDDNRTRVIYEILADFSSLSREARQARRELAQLKASEDAYNTASQRSRQQATRTADARQRATTREIESLRTLNRLIQRRATVEGRLKTASRQSNDAIKAQNRALETNAQRYVNAADAARTYARLQRSVSRNTPTATTNIRQASPLQQRSTPATRPAPTARPRFTPDAESTTSAASDGAATASTNRRTDSTNLLARAYQFVARTAGGARAAEEALGRAQARHSETSTLLGIAEQRLAETRARAPMGSAQVMAAELRATRARLAHERATNDLVTAQQRLRRELSGLTPAMRQAEAGSNRLFRQFQRFGNWRPRLIPPFVALVPVIAAVVAAINPLVSLLGAVGAAAFGLTSNIASLSGAFLALPGILSAVVGGISSVIASMGGVGNVFKTYSAMQKAMGKGGVTAGAGGESAAERADRLARAELNLAKAQRNVQKAQVNLNKARQQALEDLMDLRREVERASITEARAIADLQQARDNYNNVMADPSSQAGDKADAAVRIREAEAELEDVRRRNIEAANELNEAERKGVEGSEQVLDAKENLQDAILDERDAQRDLRKEYNGGTQAVDALATATNEYEEALAKLSPSARAVVLALIAMKDNWEAMKRSVQEEFFAPIVNQLGRLPSIIETIGAFLRPSARAMGEFVARFMELIDSPEWKSDLAKIGEQNAGVIENLADGFLSLSNFFKDLILAAGPFTDWLTGAFAEGLENLAQLVDTDPEKQGLAAWLEKVRGRLEKWWGIVKNVASTLFNYGSAASSFGDWISDNLLEMTAGWKRNSEEAAKDGSPFQKYLEDIKPLLSEVNGLLGDFFSWLSQEMMDPANIQDAQDLVKVLRDDLGPAISGLLDSLAKTDIDEKIIQAISSIITSITEIIDAGGGAAFETFADIVTGFFRGVADFLGGLKEGDADFLLSLIGGIAALSFIGKFTGVTNLIGGLLSLVGGKSALTGIFGSLKGLDALKFSGLLKLLPGLTGFVAILTGQAMKDSAPEGKAGAPQRVGGDILSNVGAGAGTGALAGSVVPGVGTAVGGFAGAALALITSAFTLPQEDIDAFNDMVNGALNEFWSGVNVNVEDLNTTVNTELGNFWRDVGINLQNAGAGISNWWNEMWGGLAIGVENFNTTVNTELGNFWRDIGVGFTNFSTWLGTQWNSFWSGLFTWIDTTFVQPVKVAWGAFQLALQIGWAWVNQNVIVPMSLAFQTAGAWFNNTFVRPIQVAWSALQFALQTGWNWINTYVFTPFQNGMTTLGTWITNAVTGIGNTFNRMRELFAAPIRFVVNTVYNSDNGIRGLWNRVNDALKLNMRLDPISTNFAEGGVYGKNRSVLPGYNPGIDNHHFIDQNGNRLNLGGGEGILIPQATRMLGGSRGIEDINRKAKAGASFAKGGVFGEPQRRKPRTGGPWEEVTKFAGDVFNNVGSFIRDAAGNVTSFFSNPVKFVTDAVKTPVDNILRGMPDSGRFSEMIKSWPSNVINGLTNFSKLKADQGNKQRQQEQDMAGGGPAPANVMGWRAQWDAVKKAFPSAWKSSDYRPGDPLYHGKGRAIDVSPSMAIFNWIKSNYPNSRELIYTPAGGRQLQNGQETTWRSEIAKAHWDHVHWAMRQGGVFPGAGQKIKGTHDSGGMLANNRAAVNLSGKPEAVLTNPQWEMLRSLVNADGLRLDRSAGLTTRDSVGSLQGQTTQIFDQRTIVEKLEVNNPVPETVSESLPKAIRRIGYNKNARDDA